MNTWRESLFSQMLPRESKKKKRAKKRLTYFHHDSIKGVVIDYEEVCVWGGGGAYKMY